MIDDNDISKILKEAKPLYFARKRRNTAIKSLCVMLFLVFGIQYYNNSSNYIYDYDGLDEEIYLTYTGSVIEDIDLPVDEYGFLKVV